MNSEQETPLAVLEDSHRDLGRVEIYSRVPLTKLELSMWIDDQKRQGKLKPPGPGRVETVVISQP